MTDPDERPRPAYGEYATPEEQRARIQHPGPVSHPAPQPTAPGVPLPVAPGRAAAAARVGMADRIITIVLLAYGLYIVVTTAIELSDFSTFADMWMKTMGIPGSFTATAQAQAWATAGVIVFAAGWLAAALLSWRAIARGRRAWWIPVVAAVVSWIALAICLTVPLMGDPAVIQWFSDQTGR